MRLLLWLTALFAALYGGYWFMASRAFLAGAETQLARMKAEGTANYSDVSLAGFPSRFDLTITEPRLASRDGAVSWQAAFVQLFALSYRPNRLIAVWPNEQGLTIGGRSLTLTSADLRASVALGASAALPLDHAEIAGDAVSLAGAPGWSATAKRTILASRQSGGPQSHELALVLTGVTLGPALRAALDPAGRHPALLPEIRADAVFDLDRPLDRAAAEIPPRVTAIRMIDMSATWGAMRLTAKGELSAGADGYAAGRIELDATNWRDMLALARDAGLVSADLAGRLENGLAAVAAASGDGEALKLPLIFRDATTWLGPFALGPAPRL